MSEVNTPFSTAVTRRNLLRAGLILPLAAGGLGIGLAGCAPGPDGNNGRPDGNQLQTHRHMTGFGFSLSFIESAVAKEQGFFEKHGLAAEIVGGSGGAAVLQSLLGKTSQTAESDAISTMVAIANQSAPILNIGVKRQRGQFEICALPESGIESPDDLEPGMNVGVISAGGTTQKLVELMLLQRGISLDSVTMPVTGVGPVAYELARKGQLDAWISVNTDRLLLENDGVELNVFSIADVVQVPSDTYTVHESMIESGDERPAKFLAGVLESMKWMRDESNWDEAIQNLQIYNPEIDRDNALFALPLLVDDWWANGEEGLLSFDTERWTDGQEELKLAGSIDKTVPLDELFTDKPLQAAWEMVNA